MRSLTLTQLIRCIRKDKRIKDLRLRKDEVEIIMEVVIDHILQALLTYGKVKLRGLFTLDVRENKGRRIRNPQTGEEMFSKDSNKVGLTASKRLKDLLKNYIK